MSGIDKQRIVGKDQDELDELTCGICQDIFDEPVVTKCCRQTYCSICIHQWLIDNDTCPNDRKRLDNFGLLPVPRNVINMVNKLKIKCENFSNGCEIILTIEEMRHHMKTCEKFNWSAYKKLKDLMDQKERENEMIRQQLEIMQTEMDKFKEINEKFAEKDRENEMNKQELKTIQNEILKLKEVNERLADKQTENNLLKQQLNKVSNILSKMNESDYELIKQREAIETIRKNPNYRVTNECELAQINKDYIILQMSRSFQCNDSFKQISKYINEKLIETDEMKPYTWLVMVNFESANFTTYVQYDQMLCVEFNEIVVRIYGFQKLLDQKTEIELARKCIEDYEVVNKTKISEDLLKSFIVQCQIFINSSEGYSSLSQCLKNKLDTLTESTWFVIVHHTDITNFCIHFYKKMGINMGRLKIRAYQIGL